MIRPFQIVETNKIPGGTSVRFIVSNRTTEGTITRTKTLHGNMTAVTEDIEGELYKYLKTSGWIQ